MKLYVDVDGTILSSELDEMFKEKIEEDGLLPAINWYDNFYKDDLTFNTHIIEWVLSMKYDMNYELVLWTNRGSNQIEMTKKNLGDLWYEFEDHLFYEGKKSKCSVDGIVVDNEFKNIHCGIGGILV